MSNYECEARRITSLSYMSTFDPEITDVQLRKSAVIPGFLSVTRVLPEPESLLRGGLASHVDESKVLNLLTSEIRVSSSFTRNTV